MKREEILTSMGLKVIHYNDIVVLNNFNNVKKNFKEQINNRAKELGI